MDSYVKYKEESILYEIIHKINSQYNLFPSQKLRNTDDVIVINQTLLNL